MKQNNSSEWEYIRAFTPDTSYDGRVAMHSKWPQGQYLSNDVFKNIHNSNKVNCIWGDAFKNIVSCDDKRYDHLFTELTKFQLQSKLGM